MQTKKNEIWVGIFLLLTFITILFFFLRVINVKSLSTESTWKLHATFENIGGLKMNAPVKIGGVVIGHVINISLDEATLLPHVTMAIKDKYNHIPDTSSLAIYTQGLLGEQYLSLNVGFIDPNMNTSILKDGDPIQDTKSALGLEDFIGKFLYKIGNDIQIH